MRPTDRHPARPSRWWPLAAGMLLAGAFGGTAAPAGAASLTLTPPPDIVLGSSFSTQRPPQLDVLAAGSADAAQAEVVVSATPAGAPCPATAKEALARPGAMNGSNSFQPSPFSISVRIANFVALKPGRYVACGYVYPWASYMLPGGQPPDFSQPPVASATSAPFTIRLDSDGDGRPDEADACVFSASAKSANGCGPFFVSDTNSFERRQRIPRAEFDPTGRKIRSTSVSCGHKADLPLNPFSTDMYAPCKAYGTISFAPSTAKALHLKKRKIASLTSKRVKAKGDAAAPLPDGSPSNRMFEVLTIKFSFSKALKARLKKLKKIELVITSYAIGDGPGEGRIDRTDIKLKYAGVALG